MDDLPGQPVLAEAPPVVAVMVVRDPGSAFEEALAALAAQDYAALSILVVDAASTDDPTERVAAAVPSAFVRRLHVDPGYGAAANEVLKVVKGASHFLFVHDDVAPEPDAVRQMLESSYRGNAGIVTPKLVDWGDPGILLAVGDSVDALGRPVPIVEPGEIDQGQHDAEREVLVAPGACLLVRADLFERLHGFDKAIVLGGEDVDLCWRAAVAGARTLTAPAARVRHRGALASGERRSHLGDLRVLGLRHRLRAALVAAPTSRFLVTLAIATFTALVEAVVALVVGRRANARQALGTLGSNVRSFGSLLAARRRLAGLRKSGEPAAVRRLLARRGRLKALMREAAGDDVDHLTGAQLLREGLGGFWAGGLRRHAVALIALAFVLVVGSRHLFQGGPPQLGTLASLPSDPLQLLRIHLSGARPAGMGGVGAVPAAFPLLGLASVVLLGGTGLVSTLVVLGSLAAGVLGAGRLARPIGSGRATAAAAIVYAAVPLWPDALSEGRLTGLVAYGAAPWLLLRLLRATGLAPFGADAPVEDGGSGEGGLAQAARRARRRAEVRRPAPVLVGAPAGAGRPDSGRPGSGPDYGPAFEPFRPGELEGFDDPLAPGPDGGATSGEALTEVGAQHALDEMGAFDDDVELDDLSRSRIHHRGVAARRLSPPPAPVRTVVQQAVGIAVVLALGTALAPSLLAAAAVAVLGLLAGALVAGDAPALIRAARTAALGAAGALVLLSPWSLDLLLSRQWAALTGAARPGADAPRAFDLLRFSPGRLPAGPLPLLLLVAAILPLAIGRSWRTSWAARCWAIALVIFGVAFVSGRGWLGVTPLEPGVLLPFAAAALALAIALGAAAFEVDLRGYSFGWRQLVSLASAGAVALACIPVLIGAHTGRWGAPTRSHADVLSWMPDLVTEGPFRVLWVGDPAALPLSGWRLDDGLAFATSRNGPPTAADEWAGQRRSADDLLSGPVQSARRNGLVDLGHRLAPLGVRFVVVPLRAAPTGAASRPVPADLPAALRAQIDLRQIDTNPSLLVFENAAWAPARSQLPADAIEAARSGGAAAGVDLSASRAVLAPSRPGSPRFSGPVEQGEILLAEAPSPQWQLRVAGQSATRHRAFGVSAFTVPAAGAGTLRFRTPLLHYLAVLVQAGLWVLGLVVLAGSSLLKRRRPLRPRPAPPASDRPVEGPEERSSVVLLAPVGGSSGGSTRPEPAPGPAPAPVPDEPGRSRRGSEPDKENPPAEGAAAPETGAPAAAPGPADLGPASAEAARFLESLRSAGSLNAAAEGIGPPEAAAAGSGDETRPAPRPGSGASADPDVPDDGDQP